MQNAMTDPIAVLLSCLALLAVPGPTNALLAAAGAARGFRIAAAAVPAAVAGYAVAIGLLVALAGPATAANPLLAAALKVGAGLTLVRAAVRLWRCGGSAATAAAAAPGAGAVFVTTLLNPKSLVFAFAILPQRPLADLVVPHMAVLAASIAVVSAAWIAAGAMLAGGPTAVLTPARICRGSAAVLAVFALLLAADASAAIAGRLVG